MTTSSSERCERKSDRCARAMMDDDRREALPNLATSVSLLTCEREGTADNAIHRSSQELSRGGRTHVSSSIVLINHRRRVHLRRSVRVLIEYSIDALVSHCIIERPLRFSIYPPVSSTDSWHAKDTCHSTDITRGGCACLLC